jgi:ribosome maturation factor RimP
VIEIEAEGLLFFYCKSAMQRKEFEDVVIRAAKERGCEMVAVDWNDDDNVFDVTIDRAGEPVSLEDCEYVHRAVLAAFDRDVEDYALTVGSAGIDAAEADEILKTIED